MLVTEIAQIEVKAGQETSFERAVAEALPLIQRAQGCLGARLCRSVERPQRYRLMVDWETVEHHMVTFRESPDFARWRELAGPHFAATPEVEHVSTVLS
ncbi:heme-degrading monooxygenase HmoA [Amycolatopsis sulphurea]|uniref:Heme-degrading monooxygenase HmoA n=1 Tax=Amycolatopsis sulphurea TaxID=76022 RepID=A0A2A9FH79_9PSEU|nr:antibiotic biosynthesis monooxygenase family protein [Amycolatopsis sulphurea]PFG50724.1 heme-degrading monooxygenase HmoA [Amycolatopsis sulphurea]